MATRMQQRRGTAEQWTLVDPVLAAGEIGFETDTNYFKIGDGVNTWSFLPYFINSDGVGASLEEYIPLSLLAQPEGVATLDVNGVVSADQLLGYATEIYVDEAVANVIGLAPAQLDTLSELATAIGDDANFVQTINTSISNGDAATLTSAQGYADSVADVAYDNAVTTARSYTDSSIAAIPPVDFTGYATETYVSNAIDAVVGLAPEQLDTLQELSAALGDNPDILASKADTNSPTFTGLTDFQGIVDFSAAAVVGFETLPDQTGSAGKYLTTDGTAASWAEAASPIPHPFSMMG